MGALSILLDLRAFSDQASESLINITVNIK
jgi:hypothetical protein